MALELPLDLTGVLPENFITNEVHAITDPTSRYWVPNAGCFYTRGLELRRVSDNYLLKPGIDYKALHFIPEAAKVSGKEVCALIFVYNTDIVGDIRQDYHAVGGDWSATTDALEALLANLAVEDGTDILWGQIVGAPDQYPPTPHGHHFSQWYGMGGLMTMLENIRQAMLQGDISTIQMIYQYIDAAVINALGIGVGGVGTGLSDADIGVMIVNAIDAHKNEAVAHTKASVGLPSVPNWSALATADATVSGATGKTSSFASADSVMRIIGDRVTKSWLGIDQVMNAAIATPAQGIEGTSNLVYLTPLTGAEAAKGVLRSSTDNEQPNTSTRPFQIVRGGAPGSPTVTTTHRFMVFNMNIGSGATLITTTDARVQVAIAITGTKGIWARSYATGAWSAWVAVADKAFFGLGNVDNYATATNVQAIDGVATDLFLSPANLTAVIASKLAIANFAEATGFISDSKLMSPKQTANAMRFSRGTPVGAPDPDTCLNSAFFALAASWPSMSPLEQTIEYRVENFIRGLDTAGAISVNSPRLQIFHHPYGGTGWTRSHNGTAWGFWKAVNMSTYERLYSNVNRSMVLRLRPITANPLMRGLAQLDANFGFVAGYEGYQNNNYYLFYAKPVDGQFIGVLDTFPDNQNYSPTYNTSPVSSGIGGGLNDISMIKAAIQRYDPFTGNAPFFMVNVFSHTVDSVYSAADITTVRSVLSVTRRYTYNGGGGLTTAPQLRVAGSYSVADVTVLREDPAEPGQFAQWRTPSVDTPNHVVGVSTLITLKNMVTKADFRVMFCCDDVTSYSLTQRYGCPSNVDGSTPNSGAATTDELLVDASITDTATRQITYRIPTDGVTQYHLVGSDSTDYVHGVVLTKPRAAGVNGAYSIDLFLPSSGGGPVTRYIPININVITQFRTTRMTGSLAANEQINAMCMFKDPSNGFSLMGYVYVALITNLGRVIVWRRVQNLEGDGVIYSNTFDKVLDATIPLVGSDTTTEPGPVSIGYAGGCFWVRAKASGQWPEVDIVQPWLLSHGNMFIMDSITYDIPTAERYATMPLQLSKRAVFPTGTHTYFNLKQGVGKGQINYMDGSF